MEEVKSERPFGKEQASDFTFTLSLTTALEAFHNFSTSAIIFTKVS